MCVKDTAQIIANLNGTGSYYLLNIKQYHFNFIEGMTDLI